MNSRSSRALGALCLGALLCACAPAQAVGSRATVPTSEAPAEATGPAYQAQVRFLQHMIHHHQQALAMARLVPARSTRPELLRLAERIEVSQRDEIGAMMRWLRMRREAVPDTSTHAGHQAQHSAMPGMASEVEMAEMASLQGLAFDRRFLELMIRHHQGALTMVAELLATPGAGDEVNIYRLASEVDAEQRAEIQRIRRMLNSLQHGGGAG